MNKQKMWHKITWTLESEKDLREMRELLQICRDSGIYFDTGGGKDFYEWQLDWSLDGGTKDDVLGIIERRNRVYGDLKWELSEFPADED